MNYTESVPFVLLSFFIHVSRLKKYKQPLESKILQEKPKWRIKKQGICHFSETKKQVKLSTY